MATKTKPTEIIDIATLTDVTARIEATDKLVDNVYDEGWKDGWAARSNAKDYSAVIDMLKRKKPQPDAWFVMGEIERWIHELEAAAQLEGSDGK